MCDCSSITRWSEWVLLTYRGSLARKHFTFCGQFLHRYSPFIAYWGESKTNFCPCRNALYKASNPSLWELSIIFHPSDHSIHAIHSKCAFPNYDRYMNFHTCNANIFIFTNMAIFVTGCSQKIFWPDTEVAPYSRDVRVANQFSLWIVLRSRCGGIWCTVCDCVARFMIKAGGSHASRQLRHKRWTSKKKSMRI